MQKVNIQRLNEAEIDEYNAEKHAPLVHSRLYVS